MPNTKTRQSSSQRNTTSITNPKTKSQNTGSSTTTQRNSYRNCNCDTEFAQDACKLTDKEIISDVLGSHKALIKLYGTALCRNAVCTPPTPLRCPR